MDFYKFLNAHVDGAPDMESRDETHLYERVYCNLLKVFSAHKNTRTKFCFNGSPAKLKITTATKRVQDFRDEYLDYVASNPYYNREDALYFYQLIMGESVRTNALLFDAIKFDGKKPVAVAESNRDRHYICTEGNETEFAKDMFNDMIKRILVKERNIEFIELNNTILDNEGIASETLCDMSRKAIEFCKVL